MSHQQTRVLRYLRPGIQKNMLTVKSSPERPVYQLEIQVRNGKLFEHCLINTIKTCNLNRMMFWQSKSKTTQVIICSFLLCASGVN